MKLLDWVRGGVKRLMSVVARVLNKLSGGRITADMVTIAGLLAHLPIALLIAYGKFELAAVLLVVFGLFDALDGELARLQKRASSAGMVLDATTDRFKEVFLYCGAAYVIIATNDSPYLAVWAVAACGASLCVSYVKAKGETAVKDVHLSPNEINRLFGDGWLRFEVRMFILVIGLLANSLVAAIIIITLLSAFTAIGRLIRITKKLSYVQD